MVSIPIHCNIMKSQSKTLWALEVAFWLAVSSPAEMAEKTAGSLLLTMPETVLEREPRASMALLASGVRELSCVQIHVTL